MVEERGMDNYKKIAILIVTLGIDLAVEIFKFLDERQIEIISKEIAQLEQMDKEEAAEVIREFHAMLLAEASEAGGVDYLKKVLEKTVGPHKTMGIIRRLSDIRPFSYLENTPTNQIAEIVAKEDPQIIALVLSYIPGNRSAEVFSLLPEKLQQEVSLRMISLKDMHREAIDTVHKALEKMVTTKKQGLSEKVSFEGTGVKTLAGILNAVPRQVEKGVLEHLQTVNAEVAEEVRANMFLFEDVSLLEDTALQKVLRQVDMSDLTVALKGAEGKVKKKIMNNLSERVRETTAEELEYMGPVRVRQVEEAQQKVIDAVKKMENAGEIVVPRKGEKEEFV
ncbi:MAG: flagellar motor switch protein FliG [Candidatus Omnitrophica bacterium]|nr:flagellar motor switch protein FliG [Candidatus Omnitrophota bacterium]